MVSGAVLRWLLHDLASPVATVLTASEMLGPDEDEELRQMVQDGAKRLAARLRLLRVALAPGDADVAGVALAKMITEGSFPALWAGGDAPLPAGRAAALAGLALTMGWSEAVLTGDGMRGNARPAAAVLTAIGGGAVEGGAAEVAAMAAARVRVSALVDGTQATVTLA